MSEFNVADVEALLCSDDLRAVQEPIAAALGLPILPHDYAASHQAYLRFIPWDIEMVRSLLRSERERLIRFISAKNAGEDPHRDDEEFPPGEEPDPEDVPDEGVTLGIGNGFALSALVELFLLDGGDIKFLDDYLKLLRIPHAVAYRRRLQKYHTIASGEHP